MEYVGIIGFALAGIVLPQIIKTARGDAVIDGTPLVAGLSAALISASFLIN